MDSVVKYIGEMLIEHGYSEKNVSASDSLKDDIGLDSVGVLTIVDELEDKYDIFLDANDMANPPITVGDLAKLILKKKSTHKS